MSFYNPSSGTLRQEDLEFKTSLGSKVKPSLPPSKEVNQNQE
jgi:hypothetical protein